MPRSPRQLVALGALAALAGWACVKRAAPPPAEKPAPPPAAREVRFTPYPEAEVAQVKNIHSHRGAPVCQVCHFQGDPPALRAAHGCPACHQVAHSVGHDVGTKIAPGRGGDLPLPGGHVVCHTCHDPHDTRKHIHGLRKKLTPLCLDCHPKH